MSLNPKSLHNTHEMNDSTNLTAAYFAGTGSIVHSNPSTATQDPVVGLPREKDLFFHLPCALARELPPSTTSH